MNSTAAHANSTAAHANTPAESPLHAPGRPSRRSAQRVRLVRTAAELRETARQSGTEQTEPGPRATVMTMGALHAGHAALIRTARERAGAHGLVVVTVFVNPLQFGPSEDLDRYPRTLDEDLRVAEQAGADVVFAPSVHEVYPGSDGSPDDGPQVRVSAGPMGDRFEGAHRPGHFDGVLTVVAKLLHLTAPDIALFGQKDAQQLALIRRMVRDLNFPVEIVGVPTVREADGMALSSRNRYLSESERARALALSRALFAARDTLGETRDADAALAAARAVLEEAAQAEPPLHVDYLALIDPSDFAELTARPEPAAGGAADSGSAVPEGREAVLAVAARVGGTRLIDNIPLPMELLTGARR